MFAGSGSQMIAATSSLSAAATDARSFQFAITVSPACASVTPGLAGMPAVARPEPACASSPSTWPW